MAKILIVEDDDAIRMIISEWVEIFGHTPIMCQNGKEGLDALKNEKDVELIPYGYHHAPRWTAGRWLK